MRAAQNLGFVFSGRTPDSVIVEMVRGTGRTGTGTLSDVNYIIDHLHFYFGSHFTVGGFCHEVLFYTLWNISPHPLLMLTLIYKLLFKEQ